ncbi:MAG: CbtA family protein [Nakamurella sp.]
MLTARTFLVRGLLAGLIAGVVTFGVAYVVGEPPVASAIAVEESNAGESVAAPDAAVADHDHDAAAGEAATEEHSHGDDEAVVSRATQSTWGLATATVVFGIALGGILGLLAAFAVGRLGRLSARASTALVAGIGFVAVYFVPFLKYPPNPPAVGDPNTIGDRTALYFTMLAVSVVAAIAAVLLARRLTLTLGAWNAVLISIAGYVVVVGLVGWLLPVFDEVPADFSADLLWQFRMASLTVQASLYLVTGLVLATMIGAVVKKSMQDRGTGQVLAGSSA